MQRFMRFSHYNVSREIGSWEMVERAKESSDGQTIVRLVLE
jgi:hypothetical protein